MKVSTDASLFGAYLAEKINQLPVTVNTILDIGSGTGLLSLMMAQKTKAIIDAVEIELSAAAQAAENFRQSAWNNRLQLITGDIRNYSFSKKYDFIIANPPFFENDLLSSSEEKKLAKHAVSLNFDELLSAVKKLLLPKGYFAVLLPFHRFAQFSQVASLASFHLHHTVLIRQTPAHGPFRQIGLFASFPGETTKEEIIIQQNDGTYTPEFISLLKDYYLYL